jgi:hypothetical protein
MAADEKAAVAAEVIDDGADSAKFDAEEAAGIEFG